jgi:hypothetical protein
VRKMWFVTIAMILLTMPSMCRNNRHNVNIRGDPDYWIPPKQGTPFWVPDSHYLRMLDNPNMPVKQRVRVERILRNSGRCQEYFDRLRGDRQQPAR